MRITIALCIFLLLAYFSQSCVSPYEPPVDTYENTLVVEAQLTDVQPYAYVKLSRTIPLTGPLVVNPVGNAMVWLEDEAENRTELERARLGEYQSNALKPEVGVRYRLHIELEGGDEVVSTWMEFKAAPEIDSLRTFYGQRPLPGGEVDEGVVVALDAFDPTNSTRYYRWEWEETWLYVVPFAGFDSLALQPVRPVPYKSGRPDSCWRTLASPNILIGTTEAFTEDRVTGEEVHFVSQSSNRLHERYSLLVRQFAMGEAEYQYWQQLQAVSEDVGSLYAPTPQRVRGNLILNNDPDLPLEGYFSVGGAAEKRIFFSRKDFPEIRTNRGFIPCDFETFRFAAFDEYRVLVFVANRGYVFSDTLRDIAGTPIGINLVEGRCGDCRKSGGSIQRPDFW